MTTINLRSYYPWYTSDELVEVPDDIAEVLAEGRRDEAALRRRVTRNRAQYSLDCEDGIADTICMAEPTPQQIMERKERFCALWNALNTLPEVQGRRVDACVILGMSYRAVARAEGVSKTAVRKSVLEGLEQMKKYLKEIL